MILDFSVKYGWGNKILLTKEVITTTSVSSEIYENFKLNNQEKASKNLPKEIWLEITKNEVMYKLTHLQTDVI